MSLMSSSTTYEKLVKKYGDFLVPACKIKVDGTEIIGSSHVFLMDLQVTLSLQYASSGKISLFADYEYEKSSFPRGLTNLLSLGSVVQISLGYGSDVTMIFKGYIDSLDLIYDVEDGFIIDIFVFDARRLMQTDNNPYLLHSKTNYSDIVKDILARYGSLCKLSCDATSDNLQVPVTQNLSDFEFIQRVLIGEGHLPHEFFIVGEEAFFRKTKNTTPIMTLGIHSGLQQFRSSSSYLNREIEVQGFQQSTTESLSASITAKSSKQKDVIAKGKTLVIYEDCSKQSDLSTIAQQYKERLESHSKQSSGTSLGIPELVPGRYIEIDKIDSLMNDTYYLVEVSHHFNGRGFTTSFQTKG